MDIGHLRTPDPLIDPAHDIAGDSLRLDPAITIELTLSDEHVVLAAERIDGAIRITADPPGGYVARRLSGNRRVFCGSPAYLAAHGVPTSPAAFTAFVDFLTDRLSPPA